MPLQTVGKSLGHFEPIIGPITRNSKKGILQKPLIHSIDSLSNFHDGDVVMLHPNGRVNTLFSIQSKSNFLFITDRCNSNCLMCSQPPKDRDDTEHFFNLNMQLVDIIPNDVQELGITGGEPTLLGGRLFLLLAKIKDCLPDTEVHMLSNGRSFAWSEQAKRLGNLDYKRLMIGIPLYSDYYRQHDYIVQANNAFSQTMLGLYNLAKYDQRIEIRIVLHKQTIPRLLNLARFINKKLPFVEHIAFMGLE